MMYKRIFVTLSILSCCTFSAVAQKAASTEKENDSTRNVIIKHPPELLKNIDFNMYLRSSFEMPDDDRPAALRLNEARFEVMGDITPDLSFRVRYRLNSSQAPRSLDNSPGSLDIASILYKFGKRKQWSLNVGKQAAYVGTWEFEMNPTFEYQYSEFVNFQTNIFLMAVRMGYQFNEKQAVFLQLHNTYNETFEQRHLMTGYDPNGYKASSQPLGLYFAWQGKFFDDKWQTFYSYDISKYASNAYNNSVAIGNKLSLKKLKGYLDLTYSYLPVDYPDIASPAYNNYVKSLDPAAVSVFAPNISYKSAVLRMDYEFVNGWFITAKGIYEAASKKNDNIHIGNNFREHIGGLAGIEFQPVASQQMKLFGYYYYNKVSYNGNVGAANETRALNLFAVGMLYFVNAL